MTTTKSVCWLCGEAQLLLIRESNLVLNHEQQIRITDASYGDTLSIYRCSACGFKQCPDGAKALDLYKQMKDSAYEESRGPRHTQARRLLADINYHQPTGWLLDVGAGSGILLQEALEIGYRAEGIEPSRWLVEQGTKRGLPLHLGELPHPDLSSQSYDVITCVDVLEHVADPIGLLQQIHDYMGLDGVGFLVVPDASSFFARLLRWKWWHYRMAHIGYFDRMTVTLALDKAGFEPVEWGRPAWILPADYLLRRGLSYLPFLNRLPVPDFLSKISVPFNLFDSLSVIFKRKGS